MAQEEMKRGIRMPTLPACAAGLLVALLGSGAHGGIWRSLEGLVSDKIEYTLVVTDSKGRPIDGATIWALVNDVSRQDLKPEDLGRLVRRYSADADFVFTNRLHSHLIVLRTDSSGKTKLQFDGRDFGKLGSLTTSFAAIKRDFVPSLQSSVGKVDSSHTLTFALEKATASEDAPLLEEFDRLRALSESRLENGVDERAAADLSALQAKIRLLAVKLEAQGNSEGAAAVYYNLAYLPEADLKRDTAGTIVSSGYSRGFDAHSPTRVADRARAWELNKTHPWLEFERMREREAARGLMVFVGKNSEARKVFIAETERLIREHPERMWPETFTLLWRAYNAEGDFGAGCNALQRFHAFEPSSFDTRRWWGLLDLYEADVQMRGGVPSCKIGELPARPLS